MIHYEVEVFEHRAWHPLTDRKGHTDRFVTLELAWEEKERLPRSEDVRVIQVLCKRTEIYDLSMVIRRDSPI